MVKNIEFRCSFREGKNGKFPVYASKDSSGTLIKTRFRKELSNKIPNTAGWYIMTVDTTDCNIGHDDYGDVLWVADVQEIKAKEWEDKVANRF